MYIECLKLRVYPAAVVATSVFSSFFSPVYANEESYTQTFVVTAYYSPLPDQCCYFRGNYDEEISFNGRGIAGADGTPVYPGMIAAPASYAFGTVIDLNGLGIGTVHDRGGRIVEWGMDIHRIDIWMGHGEEGLARALAWGVRTVRGTVYPVGTAAPSESLSLATFDADASAIAGLQKSESPRHMIGVSFGDSVYGVRLLQQSLADLGYFRDNVTGTFGPVTRAALRGFLRDMAIQGDGDDVDERIAAALSAARTVTDDNLPKLKEGLALGSSGSDVRQAQKLLRYLGFYRGRTDGVFDADVHRSVLKFQRTAGVIHSNDQQGAGRIGPATRAAILKAWTAKVVASKALAGQRKMNIVETVKDERLPSIFLAKGDAGEDVRRLQALLVSGGYLPASDITGTFGVRTEAAIVRYQINKKIIVDEDSHGSGVFGPSTKIALTDDAISKAWQEVRASGMDVW